MSNMLNKKLFNSFFLFIMFIAEIGRITEIWINEANEVKQNCIPMICVLGGRICIISVNISERNIIERKNEIRNVTSCLTRLQLNGIISYLLTCYTFYCNVTFKKKKNRNISQREFTRRKGESSCKVVVQVSKLERPRTTSGVRARLRKEVIEGQDEASVRKPLS